MATRGISVGSVEGPLTGLQIRVADIFVNILPGLDMNFTTLIILIFTAILATGSVLKGLTVFKSLSFPLSLLDDVQKNEMMYKILCGVQINFRFEEVKNQTLFLIFLKPLVSIFLLKHISMILFSHTETIFDSSYILVHNKMQFSDDIMKF